MPGESASPGPGSGKSGSPTPQITGTAFNVTVNAVDANWNVLSTVSDLVGITSSDATATLSSNAALLGGTGVFTLSFGSSGSYTVTATDRFGRTANFSPFINLAAQITIVE